MHIQTYNVAKTKKKGKGNQHVIPKTSTVYFQLCKGLQSITLTGSKFAKVQSEKMGFDGTGDSFRTGKCFSIPVFPVYSQSKKKSISNLYFNLSEQ